MTAIKEDEHLRVILHTTVMFAYGLLVDRNDGRLTQEQYKAKLEEYLLRGVKDVKSHAKSEALALLDRLEEKIDLHWESNTVGDGLRAAIAKEKNAMNDEDTMFSETDKLIQDLYDAVDNFIESQKEKIDD